MLKTSSEKYLEVCKRLGMDPSTGFVAYRRGTVGFTCGKPDEVRLLARRALAAGYPITKSLRSATGR